ncbi:MAG: thioredoxin family protein [Flavobacteriia bacterium]|nr:thioredoxin family protein [Flavobacteriia bacterium]OIP47004.1 MAG: thiol reductase thioredoxin [Flavobacteriaceae bacterium CG2_30_31_66]PIV96582.1 MAG: thiol reductase thioredoxin [Flavobacteriaceae bacterium CG17_big_fil_post_rev_8_21_14_2_50_31_13]PIX10987.1 MAG: thiol reductase thioredoxin [Flavobacteriaceae bacterium CG_4_8_14_3_um_filter_31_8]PIY13867.1 MAG: thiol reductase thioredoxin [Flavobacteriaceae bacterium CG_4_10_14_3_um_filter_31_253]PIZ10568.1 MAG: thiol reductase thiored
MFKNLVFLLTLLFFVGCSSNKKAVDKKLVITPKIEKKEAEVPSRIPFETIVTSKKDADGYLVGISNKFDFQDSAYKEWFDSRYEEYSTDKQVVTEISKHIHKLTIKAFMGTWCGDSRREIPRFYKILDETKFDVNYFQLICVDRSKTSPDHLEKDLNIFRVPTIIFYKNGREIGRFVEYPRETIEKDILKIVSGQPYKHSYVGKLEH